MPEHGSPARTRTIALINQKGGVGKTTTTVNLGAALAQAGKSVLIVDLDPQAHASLHLGVDPANVPRTVYDLLLDWDDDLARAIIPVRDRLSLIASETDLAAAEAELVGEADRHRRLSRALGALQGRFDFILIDCPPSLGMLTVNGLAAAREVIIPMQAHFLALQGVSKLMETVRLVKAKINPSLRVSGIVVCMHDAQATHTQEVVADLVGFFEQARGQDVPWNTAQVFRPAIRRNIKLAESPSFGQTIFDYAPQAPGALDYRALADAVIAAALPPGAAPASPTSLSRGMETAGSPHAEVKPLAADAPAGAQC